MALFRYSIKSAKPGNALVHSKYIDRKKGSTSDEKRSDFRYGGHGNLPDWAENDPAQYWRQADKFERKNAAVYREIELALPIELSAEEQQRLTLEFLPKIVEDKPYQFAIHSPKGALSGNEQPHVHVMISDRSPDGIKRPPELHFRRYNAAVPENGGCRKDSGGKHPVELAEQVKEMRKAWQDSANAALERNGILARVDARSHRARGINRQPESYLGPVRIKKMSDPERNEILSKRASQR